MQTAQVQNTAITALGHDGFLVELPEEKLRIVFDPYEVSGEFEPVDYVFVSHNHFDHCDPVSIKKLLGPKTRIIAPISCQKELAEFEGQAEFLNDAEKYSSAKLTYWTIPAYNIDKFRAPGQLFHPRELGGVGFVLEIERDGGKNLRLYHAGDTDFTPEMAELKKVDIAFIPISGTYVMTLDEAVKAVEAFQPKAVVPMHFGKLLGSSSDATRFQNLLRDKAQVVVLTTN